MRPVRVQALGISGPGPSLVLLPGIIGDGDEFARQAPLGQGGPVFAVDLPDRPDLARVDAIAAELAPRMPAGRLVLVGVSIGGLVARALAAQLGPRVLGTVGVGALPHPRHVPAGLRRLRPFLGRLPAGIAQRAWAAKLERAMLQEGIPAGEAAALLCRLPSSAVGLARLDAVLHMQADLGPPPAAWFRGQFESEAPWTVGDAVRALPGTVVSSIPGGHRAHWTHAQSFNALVGDWWAALGRRHR